MRGLLELRGLFEGGSYMRKYSNLSSDAQPEIRIVD